MQKKYIPFLLLVLTFIFATALAQNLPQSSPEDATTEGIAAAEAEAAAADAEQAELEARLAAYGRIPTAQMVDDAQDAAEEAFDAGRCDEAVPLLDEYIQLSFVHGSLVAKGLAPLYNASPDAQRAAASLLNQEASIRLVSLESRASAFKRLRGQAYVRKAECLVELDQPVEAITAYVQGLDRLPPSQDWWFRAANGLYALLGVDPIE